jgi:RNA polymerase-binding transcription factor DksA
MDIADQAQQLEEIARDAALAAHAPLPAEMPRIVDGDRLCLDCNEVIDPLRLAANGDAVRCVDCQKDHDLRNPR